MTHVSRARISGAFKQSDVPTIACFNRATVPLGVDFDKLIFAMQEYVDRHVAPVWGTPAKLVKTRDFRKRCWGMLFVDSARDSSLYGYHDVTPDGLPLARVFVKASVETDGTVSVTASHELVEMLVDPAFNLATTGPGSKTLYAYEAADPVEELKFKVHGIYMSDFVYPAYFETFHKPGSVKFDHLGKVRRPFQLLSGGYQSVFKHGKWSDHWGSAAKQKRFRKEDRYGHRSEQRKKRVLKRSSKRRAARQAGRERGPIQRS